MEKGHGTGCPDLFVIGVSVIGVKYVIGVRSCNITLQETMAYLASPLKKQMAKAMKPIIFRRNVS